LRVLFVAQDSKLFHIGRLAESIRKYGAETKVLRFSQYTYLTPRFTFLPSTELFTRIIDFQADVVFTDVYHYDSWASRLAGCKILAHMRGDFWSEFAYLYHIRARRKSLPAKLVTMWVRFVIERGIDFAHTILPICNWLATTVKHHRPKKRIKVMYQPIEPEIWREEEDRDEMKLDHPAVISVFDFNIWPKVLGLIRFLDVARVMPQVNFYVAGSGPYLGQVLSQGPPRNVKFVGRLRYPDGVRAFLKEGDIYVHPSGQDACPLTVMEAQLMKKAVVATDVGGVPEIMCDKRFLVKDGDTRNWMTKIQDLLDHPEERESIGTRCRYFVEENFSLSRISKDLFEYMKKVATG